MVLGRHFHLIVAMCVIPVGVDCIPRIYHGDVHQLFHALASPNFVERRNYNILGRCDIVHVDCHWHSSCSFSHETSDYDGRIVAGAAKFFEVVDELDLIAVADNKNDNNAVGVLSERDDFVIFCICGFHRVDEGFKVLVRCVALVHDTEVCNQTVLEEHCHAFLILFYCFVDAIEKGNLIRDLRGANKRTMRLCGEGETSWSRAGK